MRTIPSTSKKRSKTYMKKEMICNTSPFNWTPLDMIEEILMKMKAKCIWKLIILSKYWSSIARSKYFTDLYLTRSLTRPRILFSIHRRDVEMQFYYSVSQEDLSSDQETFYPEKRYDFSAPVRGLICCLNENNKVMIGNPSTGQFVTLPRVKTLRKDIFAFFGYDPVDDVYKVLCMTVSRRRKRGSRNAEEHQVFTLGAKKKKWRKVECKHLHYTPPKTQWICSNGVVYYQAWVNEVWSLMCFDVRSETFSVVKLPVDVWFLANYGETIAVSNHLYEGALDMWVLEDASVPAVWSKVQIVVPSWKSFFTFPQICRFRGTLGTGELVFTPIFSFDRRPFFLLCYDLKENKARQILIEGVGNIYSSVDVFLDHVESPMFLQL